MAVSTSSEMVAVRRHLEPHLLVSYVCPCSPGLFDALVVIKEVESISSEGVMVKATILNPPLRTVFGGVDLNQWSCRVPEQHELVKDVFLMVPAFTFEDYLYGRFPVTTTVHGCQWKSYMSPPYVCLMCPASYVAIPSELKEVSRHRDVIRFADFFSGGFCGWSQAASVMAFLNYEFEFIFGIDNNDLVAKSFSKFHKDASIVTSYADGVKQFQFEKGMDVSTSILFHCDFNEGWWMQFASAMAIDVLCMSCSCPAWTFPNFQAEKTGVLREDGMLTIEAIRRADILEIKIILFENVMTMTTHPHFPVVKAALDYYGYTMIWEKCLNLSDVCPQNRVRFLALIIKKDIEFMAENVPFTTWPSTQKPTLASFGAICQVTEELQQFVAVSPTALARFRIPGNLPSSEHKKTKLTLTDYRLRGPGDSFATVMAAYSTQGEMPQDRIDRGGLYGSLYSEDKTWEKARYISVAEAVILMGGVNSLHLPLERADHFKIVGNAIAVPHALVLWINAMWFLIEKTDIEPDMAAIFAKWGARRFQESTIVCKVSQDGIYITDKDEARRLSVPWQAASRLKTLFCRCGICEAALQMQENFQAIHALKMVSSIIGAESFQEGLLPMPMVWSEEVSQRLPWPISLDLSHLAIDDTQSPFVLILSRSGICIVKREPHALTRNVAFDVMCGTYRIVTSYCNPTNGAGIKLEWLEPLPQVTFVHEKTPPLLMFDQTLRVCSFERGGPMGNSLIRITNLEEGTAILNLFQASLLDEVLSAVGWDVHIKVLKEVVNMNIAKSVMVAIVPITGRFSVSLEHMQLLLATRLARMTAVPPLEAISDDERSMMSENTRFSDVPFYVEIKVKLSYDLIWKGFVRSDTQVAYFTTKWLDAAYALCCDRELRVVVHGRNRDHGITVAELYRESPGVVRIQMLLDFHGGGTKEQLAHMATGRLAAVLLSQGGKLEEVSTFANSMIKTAGATRVLEVLDGAKGHEAFNGIKKLAEGVSLAFPQMMDVQQKAASKIQQWTRQRSQQYHKNLQAHQFALMKDYFFNADGTNAQILDRLSCSDCGVVLMNPADAKPWFADKKLVPDELAVVVLGTCGDPKCKRITFPAICFEEKHPVVLSGCLHQLGEKEIVIKDASPFMVDLPDVVVVSFTMWADEWDSRTWQSVVAGPVKFALELWKKDGFETVTTSSPWNRFWHDQHDKPCKSQNAHKVGFFINVPSKIVEAVLRKSGENGLYAFPRTQDVGREPRWLVIWVTGLKQEILCNTSSKAYYLGLVRSTKGLGIRVRSIDFKEAFGELKPGVPIPDRRFLPLLFKVKPIPRGATMDDVFSWVKKIKWDAKVVKSLAFDTWLVAANVSPPCDFGQFNEAVVLIKKVEKSDNNRTTPVLVAGSQPKGVAEESKGSADPWLKSDPWQSWKSSTTSGPQQQRQVEPPVASRFQKYDDQIQQLNMSLATLQKDFKQSMENQEVTNNKIGKRMDQVEVTFKQSLEQLNQSFTDNLLQATQVQDQQMKAGFDDLKAILAMSHVASPPKKVPKKGHQAGE